MPKNIFFTEKSCGMPHTLLLKKTRRINHAKITEINSHEFKIRYILVHLSRRVIRTSEFYCYACYISRNESALQRSVHFFTHKVVGCMSMQTPQN